MNIKVSIENLLQYALRTQLIEPLDMVQKRNELLDLFGLTEPLEDTTKINKHEDIDTILRDMLDYAAQNGMLEENSITYRDIFDTKIMGILTPNESQVVHTFERLMEDSPKKATDYFYDFSRHTNYIRTNRIKKNIGWNTATPYGDLKITINLSKPEKDPKAIAAARNAKNTAYPACPICPTNIGFAGSVKQAARQNHRIIPLSLNGEQWWMQYSPYTYYNEHCIVLSDKHTPMNTNTNTLIRLLEFVDKFPHYFLGSNAGLPIVGGSILSHEHYQGGREVFPIDKAPARMQVKWDEAKHTTISIIHWCMSTIRLEGKDPKEIIKIGDHIMKTWAEYSDETAEILAHSDEDGVLVNHNAVTPIARRTTNGAFQMDIVLRNNRTTDEYPYGIFHPHEELHNIKKENIGLIEVAGLAILPKRLKDELDDIAKILSGSKDKSEAQDTESPLYKHLHFINELQQKYGTLSKEKADKIMKDEVGLKFLEVLKTCAVFPDNLEGKKAWDKFLKALDFRS